MIYIGSHITENINDSYMGSGTKLKKAIKEYGLENFDKVILYKLNNKEEMLLKEKELVNKEFISKEDNYNIIIGGGFNMVDTVSVRDKDGNTSKVHINDKRYLSGDLVGVTKGKCIYKDLDGNLVYTNTSESDNLVGLSKGTIVVKDKFGKRFRVSLDDERYLSGELEQITKGMVVVFDKYNNILCINKDDPKYISGEYKCILDKFRGKKHNDISKGKIGAANKIKQKGNLNSQYGTCWVTKNGLNMKVQKESLNQLLLEGWVKGRQIKKSI
jgi:hypothetical protein